jgi:alkylation response protein AidB-like acyl-CoA dehydrogenase
MREWKHAYPLRKRNASEPKMNFDFTDDQKFLKDEARRFLEAQCSVAVVRGVLDDHERDHAAELWTQVADMGWLGLCVPERFGGLGMGPVELCALAEELGRVLAPIPFASSIYGFVPAISLFGSEAQQQGLLPGLATGAVIGCLATAERPGEYPNDPPATRIVDGRLHGAKLPVIDGGIATHAVVLAMAEPGPTLVIAHLGGEGVSRKAMASLDPTRGIALLEFDGLPVEMLGEPGRGIAALGMIHEHMAVPLAFEQIGGADRCLEMGQDYALERRTFGRVIGSYQAIKHKLADVFVANQLARSNAYYGAWALSNAHDVLPRAAAAARVAANDAYWIASKEMIETFGGIGATWEADCHLYYRRAKHLGLVIGGSALWRERLALSIERDF